MQRQIILLSGRHTACLDAVKNLINMQPGDINNDIHVISVDDYKNCLGQEFDVAIVDLFKPFDANAFGAITGTIHAAGALIILAPEKTGFSQSLFLQRFQQMLKNGTYDSVIQRIRADEKIQQPPVLSASKKTTHSTADQKKAIKAIIHVVTGHRRRPLLISADRGRGKSAALGFAAAQLIERGLCQHITICAPSRKMADIVFHHAADTRRLYFQTADEILKSPDKTDLLLIDEAAAIPLSLLNQLLQKHSRIVFATTLHGYEGSGRGFAIRFQKTLDEKTPGWKHCHLRQPIRWEENDLLEKFTFDALLLSAEPVDGQVVKNATLADCVISQIDKTDLIKQEQRLSSLFGLLVAAHYQTKPSDLQHMLDDKNTALFTLEYQGNIIATALLNKEGGFDRAMARQIFNGMRRPKGNLVAQALAAHAGFMDAPCLVGDRIVRLAVHPALQRQGFGRALLDFIIAHSRADYVSCSFGATPGLLGFWQQAGFLPASLGVKRDASSGAHSIILLTGITDAGKQLCQQATNRFIKRFPQMLADTLRDLETEVVCELLQADKSVSVDTAESQEIKAFAMAQRSYESSLFPLWKLLCSHPDFHHMTILERDISIKKILQKQSWKEITEKAEKAEQKISGKKQGLLVLREAIKKLRSLSDLIV